MNKGELFRRKKVFTRGQKSLEERVAEIERKIQELENRVKALERRRG